MCIFPFLWPQQSGSFKKHKKAVGGDQQFYAGSIYLTGDHVAAFSSFYLDSELFVV